MVTAALTACAAPKETVGRVDTQSPTLIHVVTDDGVECIVYAAGYKGGLSCNWDKYNEDHK